MEREVLVAGLRRFLVVFGLAAIAVAVVSALVALAVGARLTRSIALGFYLSGAMLLIAGFFAGNRGPVRAKRNQPIPLFGSRFVRWATREELDEAMNTSAVYVSLGFALILVAVVTDTI
jgi:hypothetical protein